MTKNAVLRFVTIIFAAVTVIFLYALAHEGSHALAVLYYGGQITRFTVNFFSDSPSISYTGISDPAQLAVISLAGPVLPLALALPATHVVRRAKGLVLRSGALLFLIALLPTVLMSAAVALAAGMGSDLSSEDIAKFIVHSGINPFAAAVLFVGLFALLLIFVLRVGRVKDAFKHVLCALRGSSQPRPAAVALRAVVLLLLLAGGAAVVHNAVGYRTPPGPEFPYHTKLDLNLEDVKAGSHSFYWFRVDEPTVFDFIYNLRLKPGSDFTLSLVNLGGEPFPFSGSDTVVMYQGYSPLSQAQFTGFTLMPGEYALEASSGSSGLLTMYINSREPSEGDREYLRLLGMIRDATFTAQSYASEGYELIYEGEVPVGRDQFLLDLPADVGRSFSAFAVGGGSVTLIYTVNGETQTLLDDFDGTVGRWVPPLPGTGELRASVRGVPVRLYIYAK